MSYELERRAVHLSGTLVPVAYLLELITWRQLQLLVGVAAVVAVVLEAVRLLVGLDWWVYDRLTREYERDKPAGYALAVVAGAIVVWTTPPSVAVPAALMLTVADPVAGVLGSTTSPDSPKGLPVIGATFLLCLAIGLPFLPPRAAVPAALVAAVVDARKPRVFGVVVDDNFSIPVGAAAAAVVATRYVPTLVCESACRIG